jgi:hypothetical protein
MANFENKDLPSKLDTNWTSGAYVKSLVLPEVGDPSYQDMDCSNLSFAWFKVESNMKPSQTEEIERQQAIKKQLELKVINKYGLPYGMPMPKDVKEQIRVMEEQQAQRSNKWMRKRQKLMEKQIEKDMKKQQAAQRTQQLTQPNMGVAPSNVGKTMPTIVLPSIQRIIGR